MNTLSMAFVVIVAILSIFLVALVVPFVAKTENFRDLYEAERRAKAAAYGLAQIKDSEITRYANQQDAKILQLTSQISTMQTENTDLKDRRDQGSLKIAELEAVIASLSANAIVADASLETMIKITNKDRAELNDLRSANVGLSRQVIELAHRNDQWETQVASLSRNVRQGKELTTELEAANKDLTETLGRVDPQLLKDITGDEAVSTKEWVPTHAIQGKITIIRDVLDQTLVQLNVGSNDGVGEYMKFLIHRDGTYLGKVVINRVETDVASGRLDAIEPGVAIVPGDSVMTGPVTN